MDSPKAVATRIVVCLLLTSTAACSVGGQTEIDGGITSDESGEGTIQRYAPEDRVGVDDFSGTLLDGGVIAADDLDGDVAVVNVWGSWCGPCRVEAPALREVANAFEDQGVQFLGLNVRDNDAAALAFEKRFDIPYPSLTSKDSPAASLAFGGELSTMAVPMTVVLDRDRQIAARVVGQVSEPTLRGLVEDVLAESDE
ncbi:TlpA family protein disulfide reductase [Nocardioides halotolerans]|uniref:TlpA family protein disulfide reductase n=1 Tax=Nocardioides halotolerans TaxID=433660 RepID=UPI00042716BA|nr:TlpA disulfide reductase family protein [Nocardioides halotolerans]